MTAAAPWLDDPVAPDAAPAPWLADPVAPEYMAGALERPTVNAPGGIINAIRANLQASSTGLALRGKAPDIAVPTNAPWYERLAGNLAGLVGDAPAMIAGGAAGTAVTPGVGTAAGAFAVPQAIREGLMQAYEQGGANSWSDVWNILKAGGKGGAKGAVLGAATGGAGKLARGVLAEAAPLARGVGVVAAETTTLATLGPALEGHMPTAQDFLDAAVLVGGLHAVTPVALRLRNIYAKTGVTPADVAVDASRDPVLKQELMTEAYHGTPHDIGPEGFQLNKIGTGEGAQAYGWGLYFAEKKGVAEYYATTKIAYDKTADFIKERGWRAVVEGQPDAFFPSKVEAETYARQRAIELGGAPNLYRVQIPATAVSRMLQWDLELRQHPESVRAILEKIPGYAPGLSGAEFYRRLVAEESAGTELSRAMARLSGVDPYSAEMSSLSTGQLASAYLRAQGIPGIRYLDQLSRARDADRETFNFVLFDESLVRIVEKNGQPVTFDVPSKYQARAVEENARAAVVDPKDLSPEAQQVARELADKPFTEVPQTPGGPKLKGYPNFNYINGEADLAGAISRLAELNREQITKATRGTVPVEQTVLESQRRLADMLGTTTDKIAFSRVLAPDQLAAENFLRAKLAVDAAAAWKQASKEIADLGARATPEQLANYMAMTERTGMILSSHLGLSAEVGRAQQILKTVREQTKDLRQIQEFLDRYGKPEDIVKLAEIGANAKDAAGALQAARDATQPTMLQKILEIWKGVNLLSGPTSHLANIFGSQTALWFTVPELALTTAIGKIRGGSRMTTAELRARIAAIGPGYLDGLKAASEVARGIRQGSPQKLDLPKTQPIFQAEKGGLLPFRLLTAEDMVARIPAERMEAWGRATRIALDEQLRPGTREFNERVASIATNPEGALAPDAAKAFTDAVIAAGHDIAFTTRLGEMGRGLQKTVMGTPLEFFVPFITTPANLVKWAAKRVPGVNLLMESVRADLSGKNGPVAKDMAIARTIMGGVVLSVVVAAVKDGAITGGGIADPEKRRTMMAAGWQPYSIKIGDTYYSYERIDPIARLVAAAADYAEIFGASQSDDKLNLGAVTAAAIGNATVSQTYLSGLANLVMAITDPQRYGGRLLDQYAASMVPALIGQTAAALDPKVREINSTFEAIQARIPVLREELLAKRNPLTGEEIPAKGRVFPLAPIQTSVEAKDKVLLEAARLGVNLSPAPKKVHVGKNTGKIGDVEITPEQRNAFTEKQGKFAHEILSQIVNSPSWDAIPDITKMRIYTKTLTSARQQAALAALPPEARAAEAIRIAEEMAAQLSP